MPTLAAPVRLWRAALAVLLIALVPEAAAQRPEPAALTTAGIAPTDLRTEHLRAPAGLDVERPRLSWALEAAPEAARGERQTAYQVVAASAPERLDTGAADLWDSGLVDGAAQHLVPYGGPVPEAGQTVHWAVRVWDARGRVSGWARSRWTAGRMGDWSAARWIGVDSTLAEAIGMGPTGTPRLRREFGVDKPVSRAVLHVTGLGQAVAHLNGQRLGRDLMAPGWTDYTKTVLYATHDVTGLVREGANAIAIELGGGHYRVPQGGPHAENRYAKFWDTVGPFQTIAHLTVEHPDGTETVVTSDGLWRVGASPTVFSSIWGGEDYDARRETPGWDRPGFDVRISDARGLGGVGLWRPVVETGGPGGALLAQTNPPVVAHETFRPVAVTQPRPGVFVVDLGHNHSGVPRLTVRGEAGQTVTLRPSEVLAADGTVDQTSLKHWGEAVFRYTASGGAPAPWQPRFTYTGYRYLQVEGAAAVESVRASPEAEAAGASSGPVVERVESDWVYADAPPAGALAIADPLVQDVHDMILGAIQSNMMSVMTDCPHREKLGWLEEAYLMGPSVFYNHDAGALYAKWARDMAEAQEADGLVTTTAPEYTFFGGNFRDSPEWGSAIVQVPALLHAWTGDARPLAEHRGATRRYVDYLDSRREPDGTIRYGLGDWYDIGPNFPGESQLTSKGITATATQALNLRVMAEAAELLGDAGEAEAYRERFRETRRAFNAAFWREQPGHYDTGSQTAQAMPLFVGLVPPVRRRLTLQTLVEDVEGRGHHPTAGDVGHRYMVQALAAAGRHDLLWRLATQTEAPSYGAQLLAGATTLTEAWDANPVQSQNHFMLGHLEEWFWSGLAGLRPLAPGWVRFAVAPHPVGDLPGVRAVHRTPHGEAIVDWTREGAAFAMEVVVPVGTVAEVSVPAASPEAVREGDGPASDASGLRLLRAEGGRAVYEAQPGSYAFTSVVPW